MDTIVQALMMLPGIVISLTVHEYVKALVSTRLGDPIPKNRGSLTLNPLRHLEPVGFFCFLFFGFGWGNPTQTSAVYYADRKKGILTTYTVPSLVNVLLAVIFSMLLYMFKVSPLYSLAIQNTGSAGTTATFIAYQVIFDIARCNMALALFNIIPVYPLDGAKILSAFLSPARVIQMSNNEKTIQLFLVVLLFLQVINSIIDPILQVLLRFVTL